MNGLLRFAVRSASPAFAHRHRGAICFSYLSANPSAHLAPGSSSSPSMALRPLKSTAGTLGLVWAALLHIAAWSQPTQHLNDGRPRLGAVASESNVCSTVGTTLLEYGGSAVDAIVGTVLCVGVVAPSHSGIGGGGFMLVRTSHGAYEFVDFRETAPAAAFQDMFRNNTDASQFGGLARYVSTYATPRFPVKTGAKPLLTGFSGVPGQLRGLENAHNRHGKLSWAHVVAPSVKLARDGFKVQEDLIKTMNTAKPNDFFTDDPSWAVNFAPRGRRVQLGETMTRKRLADTFEVIG